MRLSEKMINYLASSVASKLAKAQLVDEEQVDKVAKIVKRVITEDVEREKRIDEEVHKLLRSHIREIEEHGVSYHKMFMMIKQKLAKERGLKL